MKKKQKTKIVNKFQDAVNDTEQVKNAYNVGLKALGAHSTKIKLSDTSLCNGSVDIDSSVRVYHPQNNRWDYCFSYKSEVFFVEVHTANTAEVSTVLRKLQWLVYWLHQEAPEINKLKAKSKTPFYWIQSNGFHIPPTTSQFRLVSQKGIKPIAQLSL